MKTPIIRTAILILATALAAAFSTACGTVHGFGQDVEDVGENIGDATH